MGIKTSQKRIKNLLLMKFLIFYLLIVRICYAAVICLVNVHCASDVYYAVCDIKQVQAVFLCALCLTNVELGSVLTRYGFV